MAQVSSFSPSDRNPLQAGQHSHVHTSFEQVTDGRNMMDFAQVCPTNVATNPICICYLFHHPSRPFFEMEQNPKLYVRGQYHSQ